MQTQTKIQNYFKARNIADLILDGQAREPQKKICGSFLYSDTVTLLYSRTNYGKSMLAFQFAFAAATGTSVADCPALENLCSPLKVLVVDLELQDRDIALRHSQALANMDPLFYDNLVYLHENVDQKSLIGKRLIDKIEQTAVELGAELLIIDNLTKLLPDAVKSADATEVISRLKRIRELTGASVLAISHTTKSSPKLCIQPEFYYGSAMIQNFFTELSYLDATRDGRFFLCQYKTKFPETYTDSVPVFSRCDHPVIGVGFNFDGMYSIEQVKLPSSINALNSTPRKRNLYQFHAMILDLIKAGHSVPEIAQLAGVDPTSIYRLKKKSEQ